MSQSSKHAARRQNQRLLFSFALALLIHGGLVALDLHGQAHQRRKPIAVAMLDAPNKKPPTPEILPASKAKKMHVPEFASSQENVRGKPGKKKPRKLAKQGHSQVNKSHKNKQIHKDAGFIDAVKSLDAGPTEGARSPDAKTKGKKNAPEAPEQKAVAQAGGRRNCAADGPGAAYTVKGKPYKIGKGRFSQSLLIPFRTRPGLAGYLSQVEVLGRIGPKALGAYRVALPEQVIRWELEKPPGAAIYLGRNDARCAVVIRTQKHPLKIKVRGLPVRLVDAARRVSASIVDIDIDDEANLIIHRRSGAKLPFGRAKLANSGAVSATVKAHMMWGGQ